MVSALINIAGPVVTILWGFIGLYLLYKNYAVVGHTIIVIAWLQRTLIIIFSFTIPLRPKEFQDEYIVAFNLGLPDFIIVGSVVILLTISLYFSISKTKNEDVSSNQKVFLYMTIVVGFVLGMVISILVDTFIFRLGNFV